MSLFDGIKKRMNKKKKKVNDGVFIDVKTQKLREDVEFVLFNLPKDLIRGIEIIENIFDVEAKPHQLIVYATMSTMDIKRHIGRFVYREKRWDKQEEIARKLFAEEKVDLDMFYQIYETNDYMKAFENVCMDIFAVYYGNDSMTIDEISLAINSLYIKTATDKTISIEQQEQLESFVEDLFSSEK